jgi:hypothetical protein
MREIWFVVILCFLILGNNAFAQSKKIMIFGSSNHDVYLGCLSCSEYATDSVHNKFSKYGSEFQTDSIFNPFGRFGSPFSNFSACSQFATEPPVIVDQQGNFYGRLTLNTMHSQANTEESLLQWLKTTVCK